jgi:hypothetical protein
VELIIRARGELGISNSLSNNFRKFVMTPFPTFVPASKLLALHMLGGIYERASLFCSSRFELEQIFVNDIAKRKNPRMDILILLIPLEI